MAVGILAALHWRGLTGEGQALDVASAEAYASVEDWAAVWYQGAGVVNERFGSLNTAGWLYCFAPTKDGAVFLGGLRLEMWQAFADMVGKWDEWGAAAWKDLASFTPKEEQLKWAVLVFAETCKYTNEELVGMSVEYARKGRLAPITPVVAPVCSPEEALNDANWLDQASSLHPGPVTARSWWPRRNQDDQSIRGQVIHRPSVMIMSRYTIMRRLRG
jgi:crotonobetainyl-CoA:carnitine CoA-transferase CaiB-like acyl-CoA transferase